MTSKVESQMESELEELHLINELSKEFEHRYTEKDEGYVKVQNRKFSRPPCVHPWKPPEYPRDKNHRNQDRNFSHHSYSYQNRFQNQSQPQFRHQ